MSLAFRAKIALFQKSKIQSPYTLPNSEVISNELKIKQYSKICGVCQSFFIIRVIENLCETLIPNYSMVHIFWVVLTCLPTAFVLKALYPRTRFFEVTLLLRDNLVFCYFLCHLHMAGDLNCREMYNIASARNRSAWRGIWNDEALTNSAKHLHLVNFSQFNDICWRLQSFF